MAQEGAMDIYPWSLLSNHFHLLSGSRRHEIVKARRILSWVGVRELGYPGAEIAGYLGVTTFCVNRFVSSGERAEVEYFIEYL